MNLYVYIIILRVVFPDPVSATIITHENLSIEYNISLSSQHKD
jgi:phenylacetate-coenzyme A ligase PaaK-like adenylate-forming protein